jgi:hypothetical protein
MEELFVPKRDVECHLIEGDTGPEKATNLIEYLREAKLI